ncbi:hypothetical protein [Flavobacterium sp. JAS]
MRKNHLLTNLIENLNSKIRK